MSILVFIFIAQLHLGMGIVVALDFMNKNDDLPPMPKYMFTVGLMTIAPLLMAVQMSYFILDRLDR